MKTDELKPEELYRLIDAGLREGKSRGDIYHELGATDDIAKLVASTPDLTDRKSYQNLNNILIGITICFGVMNLVSSFIGLIQLKAPWFIFPLILFAPVIAFWLAKQIRNFRGPFYLVVGFFGFAVFIKGIPTEAEEFQQISLIFWSIFYLPLLFGAGLAFFLRKKLFPFLGIMDAKTDSSGKYLFLSIQQPAGPIGNKPAAGQP